MPNRHGNSKSNTVVERTPEVDDPFIQRFKLREGWKIIKDYLIEKKKIHFTIDGILYIAHRNLDVIKVQNQNTNFIKNISSFEIKSLCQVVITADKWEVIS